MQVNSQHLFVKHDPVFVITNRTFHPPLPVVDSIEGKAAFLLKRVKTAIADTELVGEAVYYHAVWNGWFNRYFFCGLTGIGKRKSQAPVITYLKDRNLIDTEANWIRPLDRGKRLATSNSGYQGYAI